MEATSNTKSSTKAKTTKKKITQKEATEELEKRAKTVSDADVEDVLNRADDIKKKFESSGPLGRFVKDAKLMIAIVKDYWAGEYREIPWWTIASIVAALIYVINPIDLIPDVIPFFGQLDDAAVVAACLLLVEQDLHEYEAWKVKQG